jgi:two-component system CheB/CheR fusion protein
MAMRKPSRPAPKKVASKATKTVVKRKPVAVAGIPAELIVTGSLKNAKPRASSGLPVDISRTKPRPMTIVGVGASAGGLEAIEQFMSTIPLGSTLAVVIIQHLDPNHKDILPQLIQRHTPLKVVRIKEGMRVRPDYVYVIPAEKDLSIKDGVLHLHAPNAPHGFRLPIDFFFSSLAQDQRQYSVGVVLSGMGTDGTMGVKAIKGQGGVVMVQDPDSAKYPSMPLGVIDTGVADIVAPAMELPARLQQRLHYLPLLTRTIDETATDSIHSLDQVISLLRRHTGHDFSLYKRSTLYRRVERRMGLHQIAKIGNYVRYLRENSQEVDLLFRELLIGVTHFFRDPEMWEKLQKEVLPALLAQGPSGRTLRAWVPGCSTGEEAYSLAMTFKEAIDQVPLRKAYPLKIFATDIDPDALAKARMGVYPASISEQVSPERLSRFFVKEAEGYRVTKEIREMLIFAPHNLVMDPPFTRLDLLSCRNLMIYFTAELQKKLLPLFYYSLNPSGVLFLGSAETIGSFTELFAPIAGTARIFKRRDARTSMAGLVEFPSSFTLPAWDQPKVVRRQEPLDNLQSQAEHWLIKHHAPSAVLVNTQGDILFMSGRTNRFLEPVAGKANWNVFAMVRESLRATLTRAFQKAVREGDPVVSRPCKIDAGGTVYFVGVTVQLIADKGALNGQVMIIFTEVADPVRATKTVGVKLSPGGERVSELKQELMHAHDEMQTTREAMQISQEDLKSANEELQSLNEELQSTNQELTTSQEEMQSLNEELQTVNVELQAKVDELSSASNDMKNLLNSTEIATVFLDNSLRVRCYTEHATKLIKLIPGDVGRPVTDLACNLIYPDLESDSKEVLRTLVPIEKAISTADGRWFALRVMPYRTMDNRIDGVVITFTDITIMTKLEAKVREQVVKKKSKD